MNKKLPRYLLLTDPYHSIPGRVLIMRVHYPWYIFEINHPDDSQTAHQVNVEGHTYNISIRHNLSKEQDILLKYFKDVATWYHYSRAETATDE